MDTEDGDVDGGLFKSDERVAEKTVTSSAGDLGPYGMIQPLLSYSVPIGTFSPF